MRSLRLIAMLVSIFASFSAPAFAHECETSCSNYCLEQVERWQNYIDANRDYCGGGNTECIPSCTSRYGDGSCRTYGADFCARNPVCVPHVDSRYSDGSARTYTADFCAEAPASCIAVCTSRYSDGSCRTYGADLCGRRPSCHENCLARYPDGSCREYGPDSCTGS